MKTISILSLALFLIFNSANGENHSALFEGSKRLVVNENEKFPTVNQKHIHAKKLLENSMLFVSKDTIDPASGYIAEGWNDDANANLRGFTQLTSIGEWMELLSEVIVGHAESPYLTKKRALELLKKVVSTLLHDQQDPNIARRGLLVNFMLMKSEGRLATPINEIEKSQFLSTFGNEKGLVLWKALVDKGWLKEINFGFDAMIDRQKDISVNAFLNTFDASLKPHAEKILELLSQRSVAIVFGDNANLTTSVGKTIGALLRSDLKESTQIRELIKDMDHFLDNQKQGYEDMYHKDAGLFYFGKETYIGSDPTEERHLGSRNQDGSRKPMHSDYLVNEFRGPTAFVLTRYGLPLEPLKNMGMRIKSYQSSEGKRLFTLAPWDGSAFQGLGLTLSMDELNSPSFKQNLKNFVEIEVDHSNKMNFPGLATESYRGSNDYSGRQGIPERAADDMAEGTKTPALYPLGVAYQVDPARIEKFLAGRWDIFEKKLLTDHGPWEGLNIDTQKPVPIQTSAHTFSLSLGLIGTGLDNMNEYLKEKDLMSKVANIYHVGSKQEWNQREITPTENQTVISNSDSSSISLSGGILKIRYQSHQAMRNTPVMFIPKNENTSIKLLPKELLLNLPNTNGKEAEIEIELPSVIGLHSLQQIEVKAPTRDLRVLKADFAPLKN